MQSPILKNYLLNATAQILGRVFSMGCVFLIFVMVARFIGAEQFGQYTYLIIFWGILFSIAEFGTNSVIAKDLAQKQDNDQIYFGNFLLLKLGLFCITIMLAIPVAWFLRPDLFLFLLSGIIALPILGSRFFEPIFQIYERPWYSLWLSVSYGFIYLVLSLLVLFWKPRIDMIIGAYIIANIVYVVLAFTLSSRVIRPIFKFDRKIIHSILKVTIPIGLSGILTLVQMRADTFMLASMKGDLEVGLYNAAYKFLDMAVILAIMIFNPLMPILSKYALENREKLRYNFTRILEIISMAILPVAIITPFVSKSIILICYGSDFIEAASALNIMAWIGVLVFYSILNYTVLVAVEVVAFQIWLTALSAVMNVSLNLFLIPSYGINGAAWATLLTEIVLAGVGFIYVNKSIGNVISIKKWVCILSANILLWLFLATNFLGVMFAVPLGLILYFLALLIMRLIPLSVTGVLMIIKNKENFITLKCIRTKTKNE